jgi:hypothetical protein
MRSNLIFGAISQVSNRFLLVVLASGPTRALHRPNGRIQETMNDAFLGFSHANSRIPTPCSCLIVLHRLSLIRIAALMHWWLSSWVGLVAPLLQNISLPTNAPMSHRTDGRGESC